MRRGRVAAHEACGWAQIVPYEKPLRPGMMFDLASLTKPLAGSLVAGYLVSEGLIHLKQRVSELIPEFSRTPAGVSEAKEKVRIWMLLAHSSGLPPWQPFYRVSPDREGVFQEAIRAFPIYSPGEGALYSDIGYIVFTKIAESASGERFDRLFEKVVSRRLGLRYTAYNPIDAGYRSDDIVSTEVTDSGEALTGVVHDENARAMDGVSAHAGLFSTAEEVGLIAYEVLEAYSFRSDLVVPPAYARSMLSRWICGDRCYGLGWWVYDRRTTESGGDMLLRGYGHTGFTGTSVWIDPLLDLVIVILTNRVHPRRENRYIESLRPVAHNAILSAIKG